MRLVNKVFTLSYMFLKSMIRQRTVIFSVFVLPIVTIWSTWWITADMIMGFDLVSGLSVSANMIDIHILTGGLTAVAITAGIFSFIIAADNAEIGDRLRLMGYQPSTIGFAMFFSTLVILVLSYVVALFLTVSFYWPKYLLGVGLAMLLTMLVYALIGNLMAFVYPKPVEGTFIVLLLSFIDTMLLSNPMAVGVYLQKWTYFLPAFWPTQLVLESGFVGYTSNLWGYVENSLIYFMFLLAATWFMKRVVR